MPLVAPLRTPLALAAAATTRRRSARGCAAAWIGVELDAQVNTQGSPRISAAGNRASAWAIPTNEELMIARHTRRVIGKMSGKG